MPRKSYNGSPIKKDLDEVLVHFRKGIAEQRCYLIINNLSVCRETKVAKLATGHPISCMRTAPSRVHVSQIWDNQDPSLTILAILQLPGIDKFQICRLPWAPKKAEHCLRCGARMKHMAQPRPPAGCLRDSVAARRREADSRHVCSLPRIGRQQAACQRERSSTDKGKRQAPRRCENKARQPVAHKRKSRRLPGPSRDRVG